MRRTVVSIVAMLALLIPGTGVAQSGDATWLNNQDGLQTAIGRSWMAPVVFTSESTLTEFNEAGTPVSEVSWSEEPSSTPVVTDEMQTQMLSALIYEFDSADNAADALDVFNSEQLEQLKRDLRAPATNEFDPGLGDKAYGHEGVYEPIDFEGESSEWAIVYVLVQHDNLIYQIFGQFVPGNHTEIATGVAENMLQADAGDADPVYDMAGNSTGGLWEKLNAVQIAMPPESTVADLEIYPPADDAVMGDSVMVPQIDLANLAAVPGLDGSWHVTYGPADSGTPAATPAGVPHGVFNIELWVMEFADPTHATAAAFSLNNTLIEPLGIVSGGSGSFGDGDSQHLTMENTGFVRDRSLPEGDAAVVIVADGSTLYAARVYANELAPTPIARNLVDSMMSASVDDELEANNESGTGGMWQRFPHAGSDELRGLEPIVIRYDDPSQQPVATPAG